MPKATPKRFQKAYERIARLQNHKRYKSAFIFGSVARGDINEESDFDVKVVVDKNNPCANINHPIIDGVKLDLTFQSFEQLKAFIDSEIKKGERIPMIAESIIIFDKTGELTELKRQAQKAKPKSAKPEDYQGIQFAIYHADNKVSRLMQLGKAATLLSIGMGIGELIKNHYFIQGRWRVSDKRLFTDLQQLDPNLLTLLKQIMLSQAIESKYDAWSRTIDYILAPIGGRQKITEINCNCEICEKDLNYLTGKHL